MLHLKYRPDVDGLRALAVLSVVLFHFFPRWMQGGFVGVDIFFVISGYLITGIITSNLDSNSFSFRDFYIRRVRRIFPAMLAVLAVVLLVGWYMLLPDEFGQLGKHTAAAASFMANISLWWESGYFDTDAARKPLLHLWSLGIEEQFYIVWPLIVWLLSRNGRSFLWPAIALTVTSFAVNMALIGSYPTADFYSPFSRIWELALGASLACIDRDRPAALDRHALWLSIAGIMLLALALFAIDRNRPFPGTWALLPTVGTALVIAAGGRTPLNRFVLGNRVAIAIGKISYPLYLWHWPLLAFGFIYCAELPTRNLRMMLLAPAFPLAWLTYRYIEPLFRFRRDRRSLLILLGGGTTMIVLGLIVWIGLLPPRLSTPQLQIVTPAMNEWYFPPNDFKRLYIGGESMYAKGTSPHHTIFFGDSHMQQYATRVDEVLDRRPHDNAAIFLTHESCALGPPQDSDCDYLAGALAQMSARPDVDTVVISARWTFYAVERDLKPYLDGVTRFLRIPKHKRVFLVLDNPEGEAYDPRSFFVGTRLTRMTYRPGPRSAPYNPDQKRINALLTQIAHANGAEIIDPVPTLCVRDRCKVAEPDGAPIYRDRDHLRPAFVRQHAAFIDATLEPLH